MTTRSKAPIPPVHVGAVGKSGLVRLTRTTRVIVKGTAGSDFANLNDFVVLTKNPTITSGRLAGEGVVRHRDQMHTDDFRVSAVIGAKETGKTRLVTCGSATFSSFYGLEVETGLINNRFHILKGSGTTALLDGGIFSVIGKHATVNQTVNNGDEVAVWWDRENSVVRAYKNDVQVTSLPVPRWEIPHGDGFRHWGVAQGVDMWLFDILNKGVEFTSIAAEDV